MMCGGLGEAKDVTDDIKGYCLQIKGEVEEKVGKKFEEYEPISYKSQVVAGTNYFVKIRVSNGGECVHVRMHQPLPFNKPENSDVLLHGQQSGLTMESAVEFFDQK